VSHDELPSQFQDPLEKAKPSPSQTWTQSSPQVVWGKAQWDISRLSNQAMNFEEKLPPRAEGLQHVSCTVVHVQLNRKMH